jgi:L-lactate dehydrogenase complex protein LldF
MAAAAKLVAAARTRLREKFLTAELGISGANFAVADSGTLAIVENEANIRLSISLPPVHVAIVGIDKLVPSLADLGTFLTLLPVAATGQRQTAYVSLVRRPMSPGRELYVILLDNGRLNVLADEGHFDLLSCIRCGACMNACPVYRHVSGHGYEAVYPGPIGAVLMPHLRPGGGYDELPFASSLCGACSEACPVAIPLHERLHEWRERVVGRGERSRLEAAAFAGWAWLMAHPGVYRSGRPPAAWLTAMAKWFEPARRWGRTREMPSPAKETFGDWWSKNRAGRGDQAD